MTGQFHKRGKPNGQQILYFFCFASLLFIFFKNSIKSISIQGNDTEKRDYFTPIKSI